MAETVIWDQGVAYDLSGVHNNDFAVRIGWALRTGFAYAVRGPALNRLLTVLRTGTARKVAFYTSLSDMQTSMPPETAAAGLAVWTDGTNGQPEGFTGPPEQRRDLKIYLTIDPYLQSALEYTWHELLHLTVPFTHGQAEQKGVGAISGADNEKWYPIIAQIGRELPPWGIDPITGQRVVFQQPFAATGCACGLV